MEDLKEEEKENCSDSKDSENMPSNSLSSNDVVVEICGKSGVGVAFGDVVKAARAASLTEVQEGELKPLLEYDKIKLCYAEDDK